MSEVICTTCKRFIDRPTNRLDEGLRKRGFCTLQCSLQHMAPQPYMVVYPRGRGSSAAIGALVLGDFSNPAFASTLSEANAKRVVAGDIVVHADSRKVVTDPSWLWEWEVKAPVGQSFARNCISEQEWVDMMNDTGDATGTR